VRSFKDPRIRLIKQENAGVSAARNRGIQEAKAPYVALLDADDEWTSIFLEEILKLNNEFPEAGIYSTAYCIFQPDGQQRIAKYKQIPPAPWKGLLPSYFLAATLGEHPVCSSSVCIPKEILLETGGFKVGAWWGEDDDLWGRIAIKYPIAFSWRVGAINHREAVNRACNRSNIVEEHPFVKTAQELIKKNQVPEEIINDLKECIAKYQISAAVHDIHRGNRKVAKNTLKNCNTKLHMPKKIFWYFWAIIPTRIFDKILEIKKYTFNVLGIS